MLKEKEPDEYYDLKGSLKKLKEKWVQQLQPFGYEGYQMKIPNYDAATRMGQLIGTGDLRG